MGSTPAYKKINKLINAIGKPKEKRFNDGADRVITPIAPCIKRSPPTTGRLIEPLSKAFYQMCLYPSD